MSVMFSHLFRFISYVRQNVSAGDKFGSVSSKTSELLSTTSESTATSAYVQTPAARARSVCTLLERDGLVNRFDGGVAESAIGITDFLASK